jgi:hypothetical protein
LKAKPDDEIICCWELAAATLSQVHKEVPQHFLSEPLLQETDFNFPQQYLNCSDMPLEVKP